VVPALGGGAGRLGEESEMALVMRGATRSSVGCL
jgi:hypothetical protein